MPTIDWRVAFFRRAFLRHAPRRYAVMLTPDQAQRLGQKYMERRRMITDRMIARHRARHLHTGRFGDLVIGGQRISIDQDPVGALAELRHVYHENLSAGLPQRPTFPQLATTAARSQNGEEITISQYNQAHDVEDLIRFYGARPAKRRGLYFCPFHPDEHASLQVYTVKGHRYVHCLSAHSDCPLARHGRNDAFNVYCIGENLDAKHALRRLNNR